MWPDWVSNPGPLTYESGVLPTALRSPASYSVTLILCVQQHPDDVKKHVSDLANKPQHVSKGTIQVYLTHKKIKT